MKRAEFWAIEDILTELTRREWDYCNRFTELNCDNAQAVKERSRQAASYTNALNDVRRAMKDRLELED